MPKKIISKQQVIKAAQIVVANNLNPTLVAVRKQLNYCGSDSTIHKYLSQWKTECFKNMLQEDCKEENRQFSQEVNELERSLKLELHKQIQHNEEYAQELIHVEKTIVALKEENHKLQAINQELQLELKEATSIKATLVQVNQEIQHKLEQNDNKVIIQQQQLIATLQAELKELNAKSMKVMQEISSSGHEVLMQEKVISINLQAKIDSLNKELLESNKQLNTAILKAQVQTQPLLRQIDWQQKMIQTYIDPNKLQQLEEEKSRATFNSPIEVSCGK